MSEAFAHVLELLSRYIHVVCATFLVGGTLFYEMVVPAAIADLKEEQQLAVMGRARWIFNRIVWTSVVLMIISGVVSSRRHLPDYTRDQNAITSSGEAPMPAVRRPGWWWVAHLSTGGLALLVAISLTAGKRPPEYPVMWMRLNLVILLVVIFLGSAARH